MTFNKLLSIFTSLLISLIIFQLGFIASGTDTDLLYQNYQWYVLIAIFSIPVFFIIRKKVFPDLKKVKKESYYKHLK